MGYNNGIKEQYNCYTGARIIEVPSTVLYNVKEH